MSRCLVGALTLLVSSSAFADDLEGRLAPDEPSVFEAGLYGGEFISNYYHQFYNVAAQPYRQQLDRLDPELGVRFAYFFIDWLGAEVEGSWVRATTKETSDSASIFSLRAQAILEHRCPCTTLDLPPRVVPFATVGLGVWHTSSPDDVLGSDTDTLLHVGAGVRLFVTKSIAIRAEGRFLRGPSAQAPYTLNASYGEVLVGVSFVPSFGAASEPSSHDVVVAARPSDTDGDGIPDRDDKCPREPEDKDLFDDADGCPDADNDGDGIPDASDKCPMEAEDKDGFADDDGCVDRDNDGDGVADAQDACPMEVEDRDNYRDGDGCPDPDNDHDGILDAADKCPNDPEVINGVDDDDGCPDRGDALVVLSTDRLELLAPIPFTGAKLKKESVTVLNQVAGMLRMHDQIVRLRITVHVQPSSDTAGDQALSEKRGTVVRDFLVEKGIDKKRLEVRGFGGTKPLVPRSTKNSAQINERIELIVLERS